MAAIRPGIHHIINPSGSYGQEVGENEMHLLVRVAEIKGRCPVYAVGDSFRLEDGYRLVSEIPLCMHSLAALLPYYNALRG
jgi:hypothetical protein